MSEAKAEARPVTYAVVPISPAVRPTWDFEADMLFDGDRHVICRDASFLCSRTYYVIVPTDGEPTVTLMLP